MLVAALAIDIMSVYIIICILYSGTFKKGHIWDTSSCLLCPLCPLGQKKALYIASCELIALESISQ